MQPITNSLIIATRKASKLLLRDFFELEMLQNSARGTSEFCNKSFQRTKTLLKDELQKNYKSIIFSDEQTEFDTNQENVLLIHPIEGIDNLSKSLPFFSLMITYLKKINGVLTPLSSIIIFPALHELYYAERGGGAWFEKSSLESFSKNSRLRISGCQIIENAFIATNDLNVKYPTFKNLRITGSCTYDLALLSLGKIDAIYYNPLNFVLKPGFELFVKEIGGFNFLFNNGLVSSNQKLGEKIKQLSLKT